MCIRDSFTTGAPGSAWLPAQSANDGLEWRDLQVLECNVDDLNPELWDVVMERLLEAGALDVWLSPIQMKKNRPAQQLGVLCAPSEQAVLLEVILKETTTLGVRVAPVRRAAMAREMRTVQTSFGAIAVKVARWDKVGLERAIPEYEDVKQLAHSTGVPAREIYQAALKAL